MFQTTEAFDRVIQARVERPDGVACLLQCAHVFAIDFTEDDKQLEIFAGSASEGNLGAFLRAKIDEKLSLKAFNQLVRKVPDREALLARLSNSELQDSDLADLLGEVPDREHLHLKFQSAKKARLDIFQSLVVHYEQNVQIVNEYRQRLLLLKSRGTKKNKWGDTDETEWANTLKEFAAEKLLGAETELGLNDLPELVSAFLAHNKQNHAFARFAKLCLELKIAASNVAEDHRVEQLTGEDFEIRLKNEVESAFPRLIVETTPRTGDQGADLLVSYDDIRVVIQAKYYSGAVGNGAVQEVYAAKEYYDAMFAIVVTSSEYTASAETLADKLHVLLCFDSNLVKVLGMIFPGHEVGTE